MIGALLAAIPILYFCVLPALLRLLTPKPLPGIPYRKGRQYPILGDAIDARRWFKEQKSITQWLDGCTMAFMYGGEDWGRRWGVLDGARCPDDWLANLEGKDLHRNPYYEGIWQAMFGIGNRGRHVVITDLKEIRSILTKRTDEFDRSDMVCDSLQGVASTGQLALKTDSTWKHHRRALGSIMTGKNLRSCHPKILDASNNLVSLWCLKSRSLQKGQFFESYDDLRYFTSDASTAIVSGTDFGLLRGYIEKLSPIRRPFNTVASREAIFPFEANAIFRASERLLDTLPIFSVLPRLSIFLQKLRPSFRHDIGLVHAFIDKQIAKGRLRAKSRGEDITELADCVIDQILLKDATDDALSEPELRDEIIILLAASQDTTSRTLSWGIKLLARHPQVQRRLREESMTYGLHEREMDYDDLLVEKMPYLEAVVYEILRLAGVVPATTRTATKDAIVLGKRIPKGTTLYFPLTMIASLPLEDTAADPTNPVMHHVKWQQESLGRFDPDRWLNDAGSFDGQSGARSLPFSAGQRGCFGKGLAMLELKTALSEINSAFFLESIPHENDSDDFEEDLSRKPKTAFVRPVPWESLTSGS